MSDDYNIRDHDLKAKFLPQYLAQRVAIFARKNFGIDEHSLVQLATEFTKDRYGGGHVGEKVYISQGGPNGVAVHTATIASPVFFDPKAERQNA